MKHSFVVELGEKKEEKHMKIRTIVHCLEEESIIFEILCLMWWA